jgi:hypothetical protein
MSLAEPILITMTPNNLHLLTAAFLIILGLEFSGLDFLSRFARFIGVSSLIRSMLVLIIVNSFTADLVWCLKFESQTLANVGIAVLSGFILSTMGAVGGVLIENIEEFDKRILKLGQGTSLVMMGLRVLAISIPNWVMGIKALEFFRERLLINDGK